MSYSLIDGGPAFPSPAIYDPTREQVNPATAYGADAGMSMRDYFAAKAMQAILAHLTQGIRPQDCIRAGEDAYFIADNMLKARAAQ